MNEESQREMLFKTLFLIEIFPDGMPFYNWCGAPFEEVYCQNDVVEIILVETFGSTKGEQLFKVASSGKTLLGRSKVRGNFRLNFVHESSPKIKVIAVTMDKKVVSPRIERKLTSRSKLNERIKGPQLFCCNQNLGLFFSNQVQLIGKRNDTIGSIFIAL